MRVLLLLFMAFPVALTSAYVIAQEKPKEPLADVLTVTSKANDDVNMYYIDEVGPSGRFPIALSGTVVNKLTTPLEVKASWEVVGYDDTKVMATPPQTLVLAPAGDKEKKDRADVAFSWQPSRMGFFYAWLVVSAKGETLRHRHCLGVVWRPAVGFRPDSLFGTNNPWQPMSHIQMERIGMKITRNPHMAGVSPKKDVYDFTAADAEFRRFESRGIVMFPILGYAQPWNISEPPPGVNKMYGPPADLDAWADLCKRVAERYKGRVVAYEVWNEPWIHGWTWHGSPQQFRDFLQLTYKAIKSVDPKVEVICGHSSSFLNDIICVDGGEQWLDGESNHPYKSPPPEAVMYKYTDYGIETGNWFAKQQKRTWSHWITEDGVGKPWETDQAWVNWVPRKHVLYAILGERCVMWHEIGGHEKWEDGMGLYYKGSAQIEPRPAAVAYAVMTHFLEDHAVYREVWPELTSLRGAVFDEKSTHRDRVAAIWSTTGPARLTLADGEGVSAFDIMGNPTGTRKGKSLTIVLDAATVYLTTTQGAEEFTTHLREAKIEGIPPVVMNIKSFTAPIANKPSLKVKVQNRWNVLVQGEISLAAGAVLRGFTFEPAKQTIELQPGETKDVSFTLAQGNANAENQYPLTATFIMQGKKMATESQVVAVACARRGTPVIDGNLDDWKNAVLVNVDESMNSNATAWTNWALNPGSAKPAATPDKVSARVATMWDEKNFYVAAEVHDQKHTLTGSGNLDDYNFPWDGDSLQLLFGFSERTEWDKQFNPRDPKDPQYWKGNFWDTDYQYCLGDGKRANGTPTGPVLVRLEKPGMAWRVYYPTSPNPGYGNTGFPVNVVRNEAAKTTIYEAAIPWEELALAKPAAGYQFRFTFSINIDGAGNRIQWSRVAGTWEWLQNSSSIHPTWNSDVWPCQTDWALVE